MTKRTPTITFDEAVSPTPEPSEPGQRKAPSLAERNASTQEFYQHTMQEEHGDMIAERAREGKPPLDFVLDTTPPVKAEPVRPAPTSKPVFKTVVDKDHAPEVNPHLPKIVLKKLDELPSKFLAYPEGAEVKYRSYMLGEIEEYDQETMSAKDRFLSILKGIQCNFERMTLTVADVNYLGLMRKLLTMGSERVSVDTICPRCNGKNVSHFETKDIVFDPVTAPSFPVRVKLSFGEHEFWPLTVGDWFALADKGIEVKTSSALAAQCHSIDFPESIEIFASVNDPVDIRKLELVDELLHHNVAVMSVTCNRTIYTEGGEEEQCGMIYEVGLDNAAESFLYPFRTEEDNLSDQISFG